jgi:hypothetical protein
MGQAARYATRAKNDAAQQTAAGPLIAFSKSKKLLTVNYSL